MYTCGVRVREKLKEQAELESWEMNGNLTVEIALVF
jgi:hypothetical protein